MEEIAKHIIEGVEWLLQVSYIGGVGIIVVYSIYILLPLKKYKDKIESMIKVKLFLFLRKRESPRYLEKIFGIFGIKRSHLHLYKAFPASAVRPLIENKIEELSKNNEEVKLSIIVNGAGYPDKWESYIKDIVKWDKFYYINISQECKGICKVKEEKKEEGDGGIIRIEVGAGYAQERCGYDVEHKHLLVIYSNKEDKKEDKGEKDKGDKGKNIIFAWLEEYHEPGSKVVYHADFIDNVNDNANSVRDDIIYEVKKRFECLNKLIEEAAKDHPAVAATEKV